MSAHVDVAPPDAPAPPAPATSRDGAPSEPIAPAPGGHGARLAPLLLGALGVVFGDIGTSPLYAVQECLSPTHGAPTDPQRIESSVLGVLSLVFWSLLVVVTFKYLLFVMRADNRGEGGTMALLALVPDKRRVKPGRALTWVSVVVLVGAALLYGDGIITPAISVLSALEGLEVAVPALSKAVVPLTCALLLGLFALQSRGTAGIGRIFGPVMVVWFLTIGALGLYHVVMNPVVLQAVSPHHAVRFFAAYGFRAFALLGAVVLCVTGGEGLYADMGHFGKRPIRIAWLSLVLPALVLCYFGQGAAVLAHPERIGSPFYALVSGRVPTLLLVALAAPATIIASQSIITGIFSLTQQAMQLGYFPRIEVRHTSSEVEGQIYLPGLNWFLAAACIGLVLIFQKSSNLAAAYGLAVSGSMLVTSIVFIGVTRWTWGWPLYKALPLLSLFLVFDVAFLGANLLKFLAGGYIPVAVGLVFFAAMAIWRVGRTRLREFYAARTKPIAELIENVDGLVVARIPGVAVFLASPGVDTPPMLTHHVRRNRVLHETVVLLTVESAHVPVVDGSRRLSIEQLGRGFHRIVARFGFMERPDVPAALRGAVGEKLEALEPERITYYVGRETLLAGPEGALGSTAERLFAVMLRNAQSATTFFSLPPDQVVEIGTQIDL